MAYSDSDALVNDASFTGRVQVCVREQALIFADDERPEYYGLAFEVIQDPQTEPFHMVYLVAAQPGMGAESTDADILAAVQALWPKAGRAFVPAPG